ncbi:MAG: hypothetical protein N2C14_15990, partial [Planctomycetales bacterium]
MLSPIQSALFPIRTALAALLLAGGFLVVLARPIAAAEPAVDAKADASAKQRATEILGAVGAQGGLIVHLGCGDGQL